MGSTTDTTVDSLIAEHDHLDMQLARLEEAGELDALAAEDLRGEMRRVQGELDRRGIR